MTQGKIDPNMMMAACAVGALFLLQSFFPDLLSTARLLIVLAFLYLVLKVFMSKYGQLREGSRVSLLSNPFSDYKLNI